MTDTSHQIFICDASVLIDYVKADPEIFKLVLRHIGETHIHSLVFGEVEQIDQCDVERLGLEITEPSWEQIEESKQKGGRLSRSDKLTFVMARDRGWICWTSDSNLKRRCEQGDVRTIWGLEMMLVLIQKGCLSGEKAKEVARTIKKNGAHLSEAIIDEFEQKVDEVSEGR